MEMRFNLDSCTTLVISDKPIPDPRSNCAHGGASYDAVQMQLVHVPLQSVAAVSSSSRDVRVTLAPPEPDHVFSASLRPSEARTIASALMTAAQSVR